MFVASEKTNYAACLLKWRLYILTSILLAISYLCLDIYKYIYYRDENIRIISMSLVAVWSQQGRPFITASLRSILCYLIWCTCMSTVVHFSKNDPICLAAILCLSSVDKFNDDSWVSAHFLKLVKLIRNCVSHWVKCGFYHLL